MCGQYYIADQDFPEDLQKLIESMNREQSPSLKTSGIIRPTDTAPVLANNRRHVPSIFAMRWGYSTSHGAPVINARSETASLKPMFRDGMTHRRCVVPATHYYEWDHSIPTHPKYAIRARIPRVTYLAGLYRIESGVPEFAVLTRAPAESISFLHDRMPVILPADQVLNWLNPASDPARLTESACLDVTCRLAEPYSQLDFFSIREA